MCMSTEVLEDLLQMQRRGGSRLARGKRAHGANCFLTMSPPFTK